MRVIAGIFLARQSGVLFTIFLILQQFDLPKQPPPARYGNVAINRLSETAGQTLVTFYHSSHRILYTCRVCHFELGFEMKANLTEITEQKNRDGEYCGACHNGEVAFGHTEDNCEKCHNDDTDPLRRLEAVRQFRKLKTLPTAPFGNRIDWVKAWELEKIKPSYSLLDDEYRPPAPEKNLELASGAGSTPPTPFDHGKHQKWLDCQNCHPAPFNLEQKAMEHFEMKYLLEGEFCGVCHMKVAFPLDDCERCHPGITR